MKLSNPFKDPKFWIETFIKSYTNESSENSLKNKGNDRAWADPLIGFSSGDDPICQEFKKHIRGFHLRLSGGTRSFNPRNGGTILHEVSIFV
jgi:hypothetical protein